MKFTRIKSAIRNFGHSFTSRVNHADADLLVDLVTEAIPVRALAALQRRRRVAGVGRVRAAARAR